MIPHTQTTKDTILRDEVGKRAKLNSIYRKNCENGSERIKGG